MDGEPLIGVSVVIKGTSVGTITDIDGSYTINTNSLQGRLVFSYIGFLTKEEAIDGKTNINVQLAEDTQALEEVVVVGYGTQKKVNLTGSISSISAKSLGDRPITNVSTALAGLSSGVSIRQGKGTPGEDGATIRVRGIGTLNVSSPLVVVDGMEGTLDAINPQDIESITILKDAASASIYGSRAANGVILVTTKRGNKDRVSVTYNGIFSMAKPANLLEFVSDYATYMDLMNESATNILAKPIFSAATIDAWRNASANPNAKNELGVPNYVAFPNTNWNEELYQNNLVNDQSISVNGGSNNSRYLLSAGYMHNPGLVENTGIKRYSYRANVEADVKKWLTLGTRSYATITDKEIGNYADALNFSKQSTPGIYPRYNGKYGYPEADGESGTANNIFTFLNNRIGENKTSRINTTIYSKISPMKGLSWDFNFNYTRQFLEKNDHTNPEVGERVKFGTGEIVSLPTDISQLSTFYQTKNNSRYTLENLLRYNIVVDSKHDIGALLGYNETYYFEYDHEATKKGLFDKDAYVFDAATEMISIKGNASDWGLRSWFGRLNYAYNQRYLLEANFRYDGSSRFHSDYRWGMFPSFSAGWRLSEEAFMKDVSLVENLKLRASWGKLGNNEVGRFVENTWTPGNYEYQALYGPVGYSFNGLQVTGLRPGNISNQMLMWEATSVKNIGFDAAFLKNRLSLEVDMYEKITDGILTAPDVYLSMGLISAPVKNTAEVKNKGLEITLGWRDKIGEVNYFVSGNFSYNHNRVSKYKGGLVEEWRTDPNGKEYYYSNIGDVSTGSNKRVLEGHVMNEHYLLDVYQGSGSYNNADGSINIHGGPTDGMIRTAQDMDWLKAMMAEGYKFMPNQSVAENKIWYGDYIYADNNGDGIYGSNYDRSFSGSSDMPKYSFGLQMSASWKNFDLSLIWAGQAGFEIYWLENGYNNSNARAGTQIGKMLEKDHYFYDFANASDPRNNINASYPRLKLSEADGQNTQASSRWLYDGSYLKLKNLTLGYSVPTNIAKRLHTEQIRMYLSGENLLTITSFPGLDPEMGGNSNYPTLKQAAFGINITF